MMPPSITALSESESSASTEYASPEDLFAARPKLSVVIPTFNRRDSLRLTLEGLTRQTFPRSHFEVLVVSDGSTDGTDAMLVEYARSAPYRLRPIFQANSGPSAARNHGIREAQFDVIVFLDDDVEPLPEFLERHAAHHCGDDKVAVLGPMSPDPVRRREAVWIAWEHAKLQDIYAFFRPGGEFTGRDAGAMHFYSGNASVRRRWLLAVDGFNEAFKRQEDVELADRLERECGVRFVFDFGADGLHRPVRTFESWLRIPEAYGSLDAERLRSGSLSFDDVRHHARRRNVATRWLTRACMAAPALLPLVVVGARASSGIFYRWGMRQAAMAVLSALYNTVYSVSLMENSFVFDGKPDWHC